MTSLSEYHVVVAVARLRSFRAAAKELGMSTTALSHAVATLERRLGARLFHRTTRSVSTTDLGEQFIARIAPALQQIGEAVEDINSLRDSPSGTLRINTSRWAAGLIFRPIVLEYIARYPEMTIVVVTEDSFVDVVGKGFDAGIRSIEDLPGDMISVPIGGSFRMLVVGAPSYFKERERPGVPNDLLGHRCVRGRMHSGEMYRWEFRRGKEKIELDVPGPLVLDDMSLMTEAALAGVGLAYLDERLIQSRLVSGQLEPVLQSWCPTYPGFSLYYPGRRHVPASLQAMIALIRVQKDVVRGPDGDPS